MSRFAATFCNIALLTVRHLINGLGLVQTARAWSDSRGPPHREDADALDT